MKNHRQAKKSRGCHETYIDLAFIIAKIAEGLPEVTGVSAGRIKTGQRNGGASCNRVKIVDSTCGVLLTVRQSGSAQEVSLLTKKLQAVKLAIAREARDKGIKIAFGHKKEIKDRKLLCEQHRGRRRK